MIRIYRLKIFSALALAMTFALAAKHASADSLTLTYYNISASDPDANHLGGGLVTNEVGNTLGTHGLPVLNLNQYTGCTTTCFTLTPPGSQTSTSLLADGEITYWDPTDNPYVSLGTSTNVSLPYDDDSLFAPNGTGTCDGPSPCNGYQALTLTGSITAPTTETLSFNISSDDMAFVYIDGSLVCSDGGIHGLGTVPCTTPTIAAGTHSFDLFFVDLNQVAAGLDFSITTTGVTTTGTGATPEPSTFIMLGTGFIGAAGALRRRFFR